MKKRTVGNLSFGLVTAQKIKKYNIKYLGSFGEFENIQVSFTIFRML